MLAKAVVGQQCQKVSKCCQGDVAFREMESIRSHRPRHLGQMILASYNTCTNMGHEDNNIIYV